MPGAVPSTFHGLTHLILIVTLWNSCYYTNELHQWNWCCTTISCTDKQSCKELKYCSAKGWHQDSNLDSGSRAHALMCSPKAEHHAWHLVGPQQVFTEWTEGALDLEITSSSPNSATDFLYSLQQVCISFPIKWGAWMLILTVTTRVSIHNSSLFWGFKSSNPNNDTRKLRHRASKSPAHYLLNERAGIQTHCVP